MLARLALLWLILAIASNGWRLVLAPAPDDAAGDTASQLAPLGPAPDALSIAYRAAGPEQGAPVIIIDLSTEGSGAVERALAQTLAPHLRVIVPDLPAARATPAWPEDLDPAAVLAQFVSTFDPPVAHVLAHGHGAPIAAQLAVLAPARVASLSLLDPRPIVELEGVGEYHVDRAIARGRDSLGRAIRWLTPHFGALEQAPRDAAMAKLRGATDPRTVPDTLRQLRAPTLIMVGAEDDPRVVARAREYHRLAPTSVLQPLTGPGVDAVTPGTALPVSDHLIEFIRRANAAAPPPAAVPPERLAAAAAPFDWRTVPPASGTYLLLLLTLLVVGTYLTEDLTCITAGLLVAHGALGFWPATLACLLGIFTGDLGLYFLGRYLGRPALTRRPLRWLLSAGQLARSEAWFARRGAWVIILSRFVPGSRVPAYVTAGVLRMPTLRFARFFALAAGLWTPALVGLAYLVGDRALRWIEMWGNWALPLAILAILGLLLGLRLATSLATHRGRRLLYAALQRRLRWEFWPPWMFYPPVVLYILYLGLRHRGLTVFTAANPAMPASGFVGESKAQILAGLGTDHPHVLPAALIPPGDTAARTAFVLDFAQAHDLDYPLVLKPDAGERGRDVTIIRDQRAVEHYLRSHPVETLVQAFAPGHEFGVFYYRHPHAEHGNILAVTDKRPVAVTGDGRRTVEQLILDDPRAVFMAPHFLEVHSAALEYVPAPKESFPLVEVGTHCRGCLFLDGEWVLTPALTEAIDTLSRGYDGFYFGRYDIRTPCVEDFRQGRNFKVIELNGVTSEATNIYDPSNSLLSAYRVLMRQWRLAFEIGAANRARGAPTTSARELLTMVRATAASNPDQGTDPLH